MKSIVMVIDSLSGGGAEKVALSLSGAMVKLGNKVTILSLSEHCDYNLPENIEVHYLFSGKASKVDRFWQLTKSVRKLERWFAQTQLANGKFDLILSNLDKSNNLLAYSSLSENSNLFFIIHNSVDEELKRQKKLGPFAYLYLKRSKAKLSNKQLIAVSKGIEKEITSGSKINPLSIQTIYNPFDIQEIDKQSKIDNAKIPETEYIIHVGRLARQKRHDILFAAFKAFDSRYKLVLLCNKPEKAKKLAEKYGIAERIILPGFQANPYNWIKKASVLVLSSDYEGFGNVLVEAICVGTKVVSTCCPHGPDEILTDDLIDFLVPRRDPEALTQALTLALKSNVKVEDAEILKKIGSEKIALQYLSLCS